MSPVLNVLVGLFALYMLLRHGRRALLFVAPRLVRIEAKEEPSTVAQLRAGAELEELGFARLGSRSEHAIAGGLDLHSDVYGNGTAGTFADLFAHQTSPASGALVAFFSRFPDGAMVLTANHPRMSMSTGMGQIGGLPSSGIGPTWAAHQKAVARFAERHGPPSEAGDMASRLEAARRWYGGIGGRELRRLFTVSFLNALIALLLLAGTAHILLKRF